MTSPVVDIQDCKQLPAFDPVEFDIPIVQPGFNSLVIVPGPTSMNVNLVAVPNKLVQLLDVPPDRIANGRRWVRSEEHTSELQSRENLVCRLLLEKKKTTLRTS